jgi:hypothetical protein
MGRIRDAANQSVDQALAGSLMRKFGGEKARAMAQFLEQAELLNAQGVVAIMPQVILVR